MKAVFHSKRNKSRTFCGQQNERGGALIYVLIAVALFAALTLTLSRQNTSTDTEGMRPHDLELATGRVLATAGQIDGAIQQMTFSGSRIDALDFTLPGQAGFDTPPNRHKVFHPEGGGVTLPQLDSKVKAEVNSNPPAGWYVGRFSNVEWTEKADEEDIILTAHQISEEVCAAINEKMRGSSDIPAIASGTLAAILIDDALHSGSNSDFLIARCPDCEGINTLCISDVGGTMFSFYNIIMPR